MNDKHAKSLTDIMTLFEPHVTAAGVLSAKLQSQVCSMIVRERLARGMTQKQFAEYLGVTQGMVSRWESNDYNFTIDKIAEIAAKLDLNPDINFKSAASGYTTMSFVGKIIAFPSVGMMAPQSYHFEEAEEM